MNPVPRHSRYRAGRIARCICTKLIIFGQTCTCGHNLAVGK